MAVAGLVHRWRRGDALRRQQLLWFASAFAVPLALLPFVATELVRPWMFAAVVLPVPVLIGVALLQRRLYDIRLVASRSVTYLLLSACVALLYAVTVGGVGALLGMSGRTVARLGRGRRGGGVLRAPARLAPGRRSTGSRTVSGPSRRPCWRRRAGAWPTPPTFLRCFESLIGEIADALGLECVWVSNSGGAMFVARRRPRHRVGGRQRARPSRCFRLTAYGREVGHLRWVGRIEAAADRVLLEHVAQQLGGVVHSAGLVQSLTRAREQLVVEPARRSGVGCGATSTTDSVRSWRPSRCGSTRCATRLAAQGSSSMPSWSSSAPGSRRPWPTSVAWSRDCALPPWTTSGWRGASSSWPTRIVVGPRLDP